VKERLENNVASSETFKLLLYTMTGQGKDFFGGLEAKNLFKDEETLKKVESYCNLLNKPNVAVDAILEKKNDFFLMTGTKITASVV
jgi:hypothetical protein